MTKYKINIVDASDRNLGVLKVIETTSRKEFREYLEELLKVSFKICGKRYHQEWSSYNYIRKNLIDEYDVENYVIFASRVFE